MPAHPRNLPEQEHSIKARSSELFYDETEFATTSKNTRPFREYLRETPARPLSPWVKALLWIVGLMVGTLLVVAIWRVAHDHGGRPPAGSARVRPIPSRSAR